MTRDQPPPPDRRQRPPTSWPITVLGLGAFIALVAIAWICGGVASDIWGAQ